MKHGILYLFLLLVCCFSKTNAQEINQEEVKRILNTLASDEMRGRKSGTQDIEKATEFIESEFKKLELAYFSGLSGYRQKFNSNGMDLTNVVAVIEGKSKKDEFIVFSAHYDHIGILEKENGDEIANGADDDASGVTAVLTLAKYFKEKADNERTLVFVAFTAEEIGGFGSQYFAKQINTDKIIAGINIEMIGKESKFGKKSVFITGFEKSDLGKILQDNVEGSEFKFYPDPYPFQNLFYRSDNASFARLGVPAHTMSTVQIDKDIYYHTIDDEVETLDIENITLTIQAVAKGVTGLVSGKDTPGRIKK